MVYNFRLFLRMTRRSFFHTRGTQGELKGKRLNFVLLFYAVWPAYTILTWSLFLLDDIFFPAYKRQPVEKPLFILSNFRCGSTFLHRLLAHDTETFTCLRTADIFFAPSVIQKKFLRLATRLDTTLGSPLKHLLDSLDRNSLGKVRIHAISLFEPEEDENLLLHAWSTFFVSFLFPFLEEMPPYQFFDEFIPADERRRIMAFYKSCLQRHLYATGGRQYFISKNPAFSAKIETLAETFPEARILYIARNPLDMLPSTISWLSYCRSIFTTPLEKYPYRKETLAMTQYWYRHPLAFLDANPSQNHRILIYDNLVQDPAHIIQELYRQFGYPEKGMESVLAEARADTHQHKREHAYSYDGMGFTRQEIITAFSDIFERFNFDRREPTQFDPSAHAATTELDLPLE